MRRWLIIFISVLALSCSGSKSFEPYTSLVNQGILPLSTSNAYLGSNLFLAQEAQKSQYLFNFLKGRGGPLAIQLTQSRNEQPHLLMFYPKDKEVYAAELKEEKLPKNNLFREWVVRGPYQIERKDYRELSRLDSTFAGEPLFIINDKEQRFKFSSDDRVKTVLVPIIPTPLPTHKPRPVIKKPDKEKSSDPNYPSEDPQSFKPLNLDQQAILMSKGFAERAENGDVIHTVNSDSESLAQISKWYTGSPGNSVVIATANQLTGTATLSVNQRIRVPLKLLKTGKAMPADFK